MQTDVMPDRNSEGRVFGPALFFLASARDVARSQRYRPSRSTIGPSNPMSLNDAHCHFFSTRFFAALGRGLKDSDPASPEARPLEILGWDDPGTPEQLADRWVAELDANGVSRAAIIASVPGDAVSVGAAVRRHPARFVGFFMVDPTQPDAPVTTAAALDTDGLRGDLPLSSDAPLFDSRRPRTSRLRRRRRAAVDGGLRPLRRAFRGRAEEARPVEPV